MQVSTLLQQVVTNSREPSSSSLSAVAFSENQSPSRLVMPNHAPLTYSQKQLPSSLAPPVFPRPSHLPRRSQGSLKRVTQPSTFQTQIRREEKSGQPHSPPNIAGRGVQLPSYSSEVTDYNLDWHKQVIGNLESQFSHHPSKKISITRKSLETNSQYFHHEPIQEQQVEESPLPEFRGISREKEPSFEIQPFTADNAIPFSGVESLRSVPSQSSHLVQGSVSRMEQYTEGEDEQTVTDLNTVVNQIITVNDLGANWSVTDLRTLTPLSASHATTGGEMRHQNAITPVQERKMDQILLREEPEGREYTQVQDIDQVKRHLSWSERSNSKKPYNQDNRRKTDMQQDFRGKWSQEKQEVERESSDEEYEPSFITEEPGVDRGLEDEYITESERQRREELFQSLEGTSIRLRREGGTRPTEYSEIRSEEEVESVRSGLLGLANRRIVKQDEELTYTCSNKETTEIEETKGDEESENSREIDKPKESEPKQNEPQRVPELNVVEQNPSELEEPSQTIGTERTYQPHAMTSTTLYQSYSGEISEVQPETAPFNIYKKVGPDAKYLAMQRNSRISEESQGERENDQNLNQEYEDYLKEATFSKEQNRQQYTFNKVPSQEVLAELMKNETAKVLIQEGVQVNPVGQTNEKLPEEAESKGKEEMEKEEVKQSSEIKNIEEEDQGGAEIKGQLKKQQEKKEFKEQEIVQEQKLEIVEEKNTHSENEQEQGIKGDDIGEIQQVVEEKNELKAQETNQGKIEQMNESKTQKEQSLIANTLQTKHRSAEEEIRQKEIDQAQKRASSLPNIPQEEEEVEIVVKMSSKPAQTDIEEIDEQNEKPEIEEKKETEATLEVNQPKKACQKSVKDLESMPTNHADTVMPLSNVVSPGPPDLVTSNEYGNFEYLEPAHQGSTLAATRSDFQNNFVAVLSDELIEQREQERVAYEKQLREMEERDLHKVVSDLEYKKELMLNKFISPPSGVEPPSQQEKQIVASRAFSSSSGSSINTRKNASKQPIQSYNINQAHVPFLENQVVERPVASQVLQKHISEKGSEVSLRLYQRYQGRVQSQFGARYKPARSPTQSHIMKEQQPQCVEKGISRVQNRRTKTALNARTTSPFYRAPASRQYVPISSTFGQYPKLPPAQRIAPRKQGFYFPSPKLLQYPSRSSRIGEPEFSKNSSNFSRTSRFLEPHRIQRAYLARNPMLEKFAKDAGGDDSQAILPHVPISRGEAKGHLMNSDRTYQYVSQYDTSFAADIEGSGGPQTTALPELERREISQVTSGSQIDATASVYDPTKNEIMHHSGIGDSAYATFTSNDPKWKRVVGYVKKNPEILMRLLPSPPSGQQAQSDGVRPREAQQDKNGKNTTGMWISAIPAAPKLQQSPKRENKREQERLAIGTSSLERRPIYSRENQNRAISAISPLKLPQMWEQPPAHNIYIQNETDRAQSNSQIQSSSQYVRTPGYPSPLDAESRNAALPPVDYANQSFRSNYQRLFEDTTSSIQNSAKQAVNQMDWAQTQLYANFLQGRLIFNENKDLSYYNLIDIEYIMDMLKDKYRDFKKSELLRPFMKKASLTLQRIMEEMGLGQQYYSVRMKYMEITIENTLRYLIRAKLLLGARSKVIEIFALIQKREQILEELLKIFRGAGQLNIRKSKDWEGIDKLNRRLKHITSMTMKLVSEFQKDYKQFKGIFVFRAEDYFRTMRDEVVDVQNTLKEYERELAEEEARKSREQEEQE